MAESAGLLPPADIVVLGKIVGPYGLRGAVKVHPFADDPVAWGKLAFWWVGHEGQPIESWQRTSVLACKLHGDLLIAELECLPDRDASETARGLLVGAPRAALPPAVEGEYYWADLIGLEVMNTHDESLGHVLGLLETPANDVLRVGDREAKEAKEAPAKERLLPFVAAVVLEVDLTARRMRVVWEADW